MTFLFKILVNFSIICTATLMSRGVIKVSLMRGEKCPSKDPKLYGFIPLSYCCAILNRLFLFASVVVCLLIMAMMAYSLLEEALNQWLTQLGEAFILQVVS